MAVGWGDAGLSVLPGERAHLPGMDPHVDGILAGAIAIDQLTPQIAPPPVRISLCLGPAVIGAFLAVEANRRWSLQEQAMRRKQELPHA